MAGITRQGIPVPGPGMPPQGTPAFAATASVAPDSLNQADTTADSVTLTSTGSPIMPGGDVPIIGIPNSQDYPRVVFSSPYFITSTIAALAGGPYVPISGGTMTGNLTVPTIILSPDPGVYAFRYPGPTNHDTSGLAIGPGALAGQATDASHYCVAVGAGAGQLGTNLTYCTFIGVNAGQYAATSSSCTAVGVGALGAAAASGQYNNAFGTSTLANLTTGHANDCFGSATGQAITTGYNNAGFGLSALNFVTTGYNNVAVGGSALEGAGQDGGPWYGVGFQNVAAGVSAMQYFTTANNNVAIGHASLQNITTGGFNTVIGSSTAPSLTTGSRNILIGYSSDFPAATNDSFILGNGTPLLTGSLAPGSLSLTVHGALGLPLGAGLFWGSATIFADANNMYFRLPVNTGGSFGFETANGTNHMICDAAGNLSITGNMVLNSNEGIYFNGSATGGPGRIFSDSANLISTIPAAAGVWGIQNSAGTTEAYVDGSGNLTILGSTATKPGSTSWVNPSARDIKQDIQPYTGSLGDLLDLTPVTYRYAEDSGFDSTQTHVGLVHDETAHMPEMHRKAKLPGKLDEPSREVDALDCSALTFALINAVKELSARVAELEARG